MKYRLGGRAHAVLGRHPACGFVSRARPPARVVEQVTHLRGLFTDGRFRATNSAAPAPGAMQKRFAILSGILALVVSSPVLADEAVPAAPAPEQHKTIGLDGGFAMPTGDWGDGAGVGFGALARIEIPFQPKLTFTGRVGYIQHL